MGIPCPASLTTIARTAFGLKKQTVNNGPNGLGNAVVNLRKWQAG
jgi:hypothetical protein